MKLHRFASHTPEERRRLSNLGHIIEGLLLGTVGLLALLGSIGIAAWASTVWSILILVAGVLLLLSIYPRHPLVDWPAIWQDAQQRQHTLMAVAIAIAICFVLLGSVMGPQVWLLAPVVITFWLLVFMPRWRRKVRAAARNLPTWKLRPEEGPWRDERHARQGQLEIRRRKGLDRARAGEGDDPGCRRRAAR